jgi:LacI family repressor for deo operon, udp, cdd, tsx, nupC, and nupG
VPRPLPHAPNDPDDGVPSRPSAARASAPKPRAKAASAPPLGRARASFSVPKDISIDDVAEQAGVSVATVSRVLNGHSNVRAETRERVLAAIEQSGYRVNELARNLRTAESRLLLTMVPNFGNPFYAEIVRGIDSVARQHGYFMLLCDTGADPGRERSYFDMLRRRRADGAICLDPAAAQQALSEEMTTLPWVACCEFDADVGVPYVGIDNYRAAGDAVLHLLSRGHTRIALINSGDGYLYAQQRERGYMDAMHNAGLVPDARWLIHLDSLDYEAGASAAALLMAQPDPPTAIFTVSDTLAIGVINGLRKVGKRVPDDVAVVGFDDISLAAQTDPPLTTISQPMRELGETAARLLLKRLANRSATVPGVLLPHRLVVRGSA